MFCLLTGIESLLTAVENCSLHLPIPSPSSRSRWVLLLLGHFDEYIPPGESRERINSNCFYGLWKWGEGGERERESVVVRSSNSASSWFNHDLKSCFP